MNAKKYGILLSFLILFFQNITISANDVLPNGSYRIRCVSNEVLLMNQEAKMATVENTSTQKWNLMNNADGTVQLKNEASQQVLTYNKKKIEMASPSNAKNQKWILQKNNDTYQLTSCANQKYTLDWDGQSVCLNKQKNNAKWNIEPDVSWSGPVLNTSAGSVQGPSGKETYYNLDMSGVVANLKAKGINGDYWERADGAKMYGAYVMVAAELTSRPIGTILPTSLGMGIVSDTGSFAQNDATQLDVATNW